MAHLETSDVFRQDTVRLTFPKNSRVSFEGIPTDDTPVAEIYADFGSPRDDFHVMSTIHDIYSPAPYPVSYWYLRLPHNRHIDVQGEYAAIEAMNMSGDISVSSTHGLVSFVNATGALKAQALDGGWISCCGANQVDFVADGPIQIVTTSLTERSSILASTRGDIELHMPFASDECPEINVSPASRVVNTANARIIRLASLTDHRDATLPPPRIRLISQDGHISLKRIMTW